MRFWPGLVTFLYGVIIFVVISLSLILSFHPTSDTLGSGPIGSLMNFYSEWYLWIFLMVLMAAQACMLIVPISISSKKPVSRRLVLFPIIASAFALGILVIGLFFSVSEIITKEPFKKNLLIVTFVVLMSAWIIWGSIFYFLSKKSQPRMLVARQMSLLFKGSILELLIAVPVHIYVRSKDYCCAGFGTFVGIAFGLSVMIFSFGPGVFFLYSQRVGCLKAKNKSN